MLTFLLDLLAPSLCVGCKKNTTPGVICPDCLSSLYSKRTFISLNSTLKLTGQLPGPHKTTAIWEYRGFVRDLIHRYKFQGESRVASIFSNSFSEKITENYDNIVVIPSTTSSMRLRGYSHMHLIARKVSKETGIDFLPQGLVFNSKITSQKGLNLKQRKDNRKSAFTASSSVTGKKVLLLDDVVTSGQTLYSAIQSLNTMGATQVDALILARTARNIGKQ